MGEYVFWPRGCAGGWEKYGPDALIGGALGSVSDPCVIREEDGFHMWFTWNDAHCIAYAQSEDGIHWDNPRVVLQPQLGSSWQRDAVARPWVVKRNGAYQMWYAGQWRPQDGAHGRSAFGYAESFDGVNWSQRDTSVMAPAAPWEKNWMGSPFVMWDEGKGIYRMWYSAGEYKLCGGIGYAYSYDGVRWYRDFQQPVLSGAEIRPESCCVVKQDNWHYLFYVDLKISADHYPNHGCICLARSRDGVHMWEKHPDNPVVAPSDVWWDFSGVERPCVIPAACGYAMWYGGENRSKYMHNTHLESGIAVHEGALAWPAEGEAPERKLPGEMRYIINEWNVGCV